MASYQTGPDGVFFDRVEDRRTCSECRRKEGNLQALIGRLNEIALKRRNMCDDCWFELIDHLNLGNEVVLEEHWLIDRLAREAK